MLLLSDTEVKAKVVALILQKNPEMALNILCERYSIKRPDLKVGKVKRYSSSLGAYVHAENTIYVSSSEAMYDPRVILHEFYHHLRSASGKHRGNEKYADRFAADFITSYVGIQQKTVKSTGFSSD
jgi:hypothetical protein